MGLLRHPGRFDPARGPLRAFLLGIARNLTLKRWRKEHRLEWLDDEALVAEPVDLERGAVGDMVGRAVSAGSLRHRSNRSCGRSRVGKDGARIIWITAVRRDCEICVDGASRVGTTRCWWK